MGGFLGIGKSDAQKALEQQKKLAAEEADAARRDAEIRLAEKAANSNKQIANIQVGTDSTKLEEDSTKLDDKLTSLPDQSLGLGGLSKKKKSGVQI